MKCVAVCLGAVLIGEPLWAQDVARASRQLEDIIGTWHSDTVGGVSAVSVCGWSPQGRSVICEQTITTPAGVRSALNVFSVDSARQRFVYYGIARPGAEVRPTPLTIADHLWIYGGGLGEDSLYHRTVNDFSGGGGFYVWRQESSRDGVHWTTQRQGAVKRASR